jgi:hypothetical protein
MRLKRKSKSSGDVNKSSYLLGLFGPILSKVHRLLSPQTGCPRLPLFPFVVRRSRLVNAPSIAQTFLFFYFARMPRN